MFNDKNIYKVVTQKNGTIKIYNGEEAEIYYARPEWNDSEEDGEELAFKYKNNEYFLSEFINIHNKIHNPNPPEWMKEFDGYLSDSFFSGVLIKLINGSDAVQVFIYNI